MTAMTDQQIVEKSLEAQRHVEALNSIMRELAFEGCRVDADASTVNLMTMGTPDRNIPEVTVDVYRRVSG